MAKKIKPIRNCRDARDFVEYAEHYGARYMGCDGDHHKYEFPNGYVVVIPYKQLHDDIKDGVRGSIKRMFRAASVPLVIILMFCFVKSIFPGMI